MADYTFHNYKIATARFKEQQEFYQDSDGANRAGLAFRQDMHAADPTAPVFYAKRDETPLVPESLTYRSVTGDSALAGSAVPFTHQAQHLFTELTRTDISPKENPTIQALINATRDIRAQAALPAYTSREAYASLFERSERSGNEVYGSEDANHTHVPQTKKTLADYKPAGNMKDLSDAAVDHIEASLLVAKKAIEMAATVRNSKIPEIAESKEAEFLPSTIMRYAIKAANNGEEHVAMTGRFQTEAFKKALELPESKELVAAVKSLRQDLGEWADKKNIENGLAHPDGKLLTPEEREQLELKARSIHVDSPLTGDRLAADHAAAMSHLYEDHHEHDLPDQENHNIPGVDTGRQFSTIKRPENADYLLGQVISSMPYENLARNYVPRNAVRDANIVAEDAQQAYVIHAYMNAVNPLIEERKIAQMSNEDWSNLAKQVNHEFRMEKSVTFNRVETVDLAQQKFSQNTSKSRRTGYEQPQTETEQSPSNKALFTSTRDATIQNTMRLLLDPDYKKNIAGESQIDQKWNAIPGANASATQYYYPDAAREIFNARAQNRRTASKLVGPEKARDPLENIELIGTTLISIAHTVNPASVEHSVPTDEFTRKDAKKILDETATSPVYGPQFNKMLAQTSSQLGLGIMSPELMQTAYAFAERTGSEPANQRLASVVLDRNATPEEGARLSKILDREQTITIVTNELKNIAPARAVASNLQAFLPPGPDHDHALNPLVEKDAGEAPVTRPGVEASEKLGAAINALTPRQLSATFTAAQIMTEQESASRVRTFEAPLNTKDMANNLLQSFGSIAEISAAATNVEKARNHDITGIDALATPKNSALTTESKGEAVIFKTLSESTTQQTHNQQIIDFQQEKAANATLTEQIHKLSPLDAPSRKLVEDILATKYPAQEASSTADKISNNAAGETRGYATTLSPENPTKRIEDRLVSAISELTPDQTAKFKQQATDAIITRAIVENTMSHATTSMVSKEILDQETKPKTVIDIENQKQRQINALTDQFPSMRQAVTFGTIANRVENTPANAPEEIKEKNRAELDSFKNIKPVTQNAAQLLAAEITRIRDENPAGLTTILKDAKAYSSQLAKQRDEAQPIAERLNTVAPGSQSAKEIVATILTEHGAQLRAEKQQIITEAAAREEEYRKELAVRAERAAKEREEAKQNQDKPQDPEEKKKKEQEAAAQKEAEDKTDAKVREERRAEKERTDAINAAIAFLGTKELPLTTYTIARSPLAGTNPEDTTDPKKITRQHVFKDAINALTEEQTQKIGQAIVLSDIKQNTEASQNLTRNILTSFASKIEKGETNLSDTQQKTAKNLLSPERIEGTINAASNTGLTAAALSPTSGNVTEKNIIGFALKNMNEAEWNQTKEAANDFAAFRHATQKVIGAAPDASVEMYMTERNQSQTAASQTITRMATSEKIVQNGLIQTMDQSQKYIGVEGDGYYASNEVIKNFLNTQKAGSTIISFTPDSDFRTTLKNQAERDNILVVHGRVTEKKEIADLSFNRNIEVDRGSEAVDRSSSRTLLETTFTMPEGTRNAGQTIPFNLFRGKTPGETVQQALHRPAQTVLVLMDIEAGGVAHENYRAANHSEERIRTDLAATTSAKLGLFHLEYDLNQPESNKSILPEIGSTYRKLKVDFPTAANLNPAHTPEYINPKGIVASEEDAKKIEADFGNRNANIRRALGISLTNENFDIRTIEAKKVITEIIKAGRENGVKPTLSDDKQTPLRPDVYADRLSKLVIRRNGILLSDIITQTMEPENKTKTSADQNISKEINEAIHTLTPDQMREIRPRIQQTIQQTRDVDAHSLRLTKGSEEIGLATIRNRRVMENQMLSTTEKSQNVLSRMANVAIVGDDSRPVGDKSKDWYDKTASNLMRTLAKQYGRDPEAGVANVVIHTTMTPGIGESLIRQAREHKVPVIAHTEVDHRFITMPRDPEKNPGPIPTGKMPENIAYVTKLYNMALDNNQMGLGGVTSGSTYFSEERGTRKGLGIKAEQHGAWTPDNIEYRITASGPDKNRSGQVSILSGGDPMNPDTRQHNNTYATTHLTEFVIGAQSEVYNALAQTLGKQALQNPVIKEVVGSHKDEESIREALKKATEKDPTNLPKDLKKIDPETRDISIKVAVAELTGNNPVITRQLARSISLASTGQDAAKYASTYHSIAQSEMLAETPQELGRTAYAQKFGQVKDIETLANISEKLTINLAPSAIMSKMDIKPHDLNALNTKVSLENTPKASAYALDYNGPEHVENKTISKSGSENTRQNPFLAVNLLMENLSKNATGPEHEAERIIEHASRTGGKPIALDLAGIDTKGARSEISQIASTHGVRLISSAEEKETLKGQYVILDAALTGDAKKDQKEIEKLQKTITQLPMLKQNAKIAIDLHEPASDTLRSILAPAAEKAGIPIITETSQREQMKDTHHLIDMSQVKAPPMSGNQRPLVFVLPPRNTENDIKKLETVLPAHANIEIIKTDADMERVRATHIIVANSSVTSALDADTKAVEKAQRMLNDPTPKQGNPGRHAEATPNIRIQPALQEGQSPEISLLKNRITTLAEKNPVAIDMRPTPTDAIKTAFSNMSKDGGIKFVTDEKDLHHTRMTSTVIDLSTLKDVPRVEIKARPIDISGASQDIEKEKKIIQNLRFDRPEVTIATTQKDRQNAEKTGILIPMSDITRAANQDALQTPDGKKVTLSTYHEIDTRIKNALDSGLTVAIEQSQITTQKVKEMVAPIAEKYGVPLITNEKQAKEVAAQHGPDYALSGQPLRNLTERKINGEKNIALDLRETAVPSDLSILTPLASTHGVQLILTNENKRDTPSYVKVLETTANYEGRIPANTKSPQENLEAVLKASQAVIVAGMSEHNPDLMQIMERGKSVPVAAIRDSRMPSASDTITKALQMSLFIPPESTHHLDPRSTAPAPGVKVVNNLTVSQELGDTGMQVTNSHTNVAALITNSTELSTFLTTADKVKDGRIAMPPQPQLDPDHRKISELIKAQTEVVQQMLPSGKLEYVSSTPKTSRPKNMPEREKLTLTGDAKEKAESRISQSLPTRTTPETDIATKMTTALIEASKRISHEPTPNDNIDYKIITYLAAKQDLTDPMMRSSHLANSVEKNAVIRTLTPHDSTGIEQTARYENAVTRQRKTVADLERLEQFEKDRQEALKRPARANGRRSDRGAGL